MVLSGGQRPLIGSEKKSFPPTHWTQRLRDYPTHLLEDVFQRSVIKKNRQPKTKDGVQVQQNVFTKSNDPPEELSSKTVTLRRSTFFLLTTIFGVEIIFDALLFLIRLPFMFFNVPYLTPALLTTLFIVSFFIITLFKLNFMLFALLKWLSTHYVITNGEIRYKTGILNKREKIFFCALTQEVVYNQSFIGRLLNYGTIEIYNPAIKEKIYLDTIPDPRKYVEVIKKNLPQNSDNTGYIIERQ